MTRVEADEVLNELSAGFPRFEWPKATKALWYRLLEAVGPSEGMDVAGAVITGHEFLSPAAFFDELAVIRERSADECRVPDYGRPALESGEKWLPKTENAKRLRELSGWMRQRSARDRMALSAAGDGRPRWHRPDENYFKWLAAREAEAEPEPEPDINESNGTTKEDTSDHR